jgi:hypothetical protein
VTRSETPPHPRRHPDESQDPGSRTPRCLALGPDFRQDDGRRGLRPAHQRSSFPRRREPILAGLTPGSQAPEDMDPRLRGDDDVLRDAFGWKA